MIKKITAKMKAIELREDNIIEVLVFLGYEKDEEILKEREKVLKEKGIYIKVMRFDIPNLIKANFGNYILKTEDNFFEIIDENFFLMLEKVFEK